MSEPVACGCQVYQGYDFIEKKNIPVIKYCPMHQAAPEMLAELKRIWALHHGRRTLDVINQAGGPTMTRKSYEVEFRIVKRVRVDAYHDSDGVKEAFQQLLAIDQDGVESYRVEGMADWHEWRGLDAG